jgi:type I restriction enzyme S subunit
MAGDAPISHPSAWPVVRLGEIAPKIGSGATPNGGEDSYLPQRTKFALVRSQNVFNRRFERGGLAFISDQQAERLRGVLLQSGDLLLNITGDGITFSRSCAVPEDILPACVNQHVAIIRVDRKLADPGFVLSYLTHPSVKPYIESFNAGGSRRAITKGHIESFQIALPPLSEQRSIAHILGTLDEKIELNRRMNETLEAMARELFKSWFVDFDPVRAKVEGRDPGLPEPLAGLFPDDFAQSELGEIPHGWSLGILGDFLRQRVERCVTSAVTKARPYVPIDCISAKSLSLMESRPGEEAQSSLTKFYKGDLLFGAMRPYFHKVCIAPFDGTTRTTAFVLHPRHNDNFAFATMLLHHTDTIDFATRHSTGSTIPYAVWTSSLENMPAILPPPNVRKAFDEIIRPILNRLPQSYFEIRPLAALRDTLLPKLISGELRVKEAERAVEAVA